MSFQGVPHLHPIINTSTGPMFFLGGTPVTGPRSGWGVPRVSPVLGWGTPPRIGYAWTGYAAGGMSLAVSRRRTFLLL